MYFKHNKHMLVYILNIISICWSNELTTDTDDVEGSGAPHFRVVNGEDAKQGQFPYQIALRSLPTKFKTDVYYTFCGGALLGVSQILTAAHCLCDKESFCKRIFGKGYILRPLSRIYAVAGSLQSREPYPKSAPSDGPVQWRALQDAKIPTRFRFPKKDIAIVITTTPYVFNDNIGSLPYAKKNMDYGNMKCIVSGYGRISERTSSNTLQWAYLELVPKRACNRIHRKRMKDFICTRSILTSVLQGDSGGPLVCKNTSDPADQGKGVIVGVVSGDREGSGVFFTRVTRFTKFIENRATTSIADGLCAAIAVFIALTTR